MPTAPFLPTPPFLPASRRCLRTWRGNRYDISQYTVHATNLVCGLEVTTVAARQPFPLTLLKGVVPPTPTVLEPVCKTAPCDQHPALAMCSHRFCKSCAASLALLASFPPRPTDSLCRAAHLPYSAPAASLPALPALPSLALPVNPWVPVRTLLPARTSSSGCSLTYLAMRETHTTHPRA